MQFNLAIATAILAYVAQAAPAADSCTKSFSVCKAQSGFDAERNAACDVKRAQCIGQCQTTTSNDNDLLACTGTDLETSKAPQSAVARRDDSCTKTFSVCMAQAGFDTERNQECYNDRAQCIGQCQTTTSDDNDLLACTGTTKEESKAPQSAVARRDDSCTKTFSVCMAQAGFDTERNQECYNDRAQCIGQCQTTTSDDNDLLACTGTTKEESKAPQSAVARRDDSCTKTFSVCMAQAGFDTERNQECYNDRAQCIGQCQTTTSDDNDLLACTGTTKEESSKPMTGVARRGVA
ncbi:uncharacterized protein PG986_002858 [Apiospora aurea]|uniref:Uncharacterized protein n=1 Tax=Apiospora aurea TaxID=335848 RepID=A0ABR1QQ04_9PEZI